MPDVKQVVNSARHAFDKPKVYTTPEQASLDAMIHVYHELKAINSKLGWFVFLSVVGIVMGFIGLVTVVR